MVDIQSARLCPGRLVAWSGMVDPVFPFACGLESDPGHSDDTEKSPTSRFMLCVQSILLTFAARQFCFTQVAFPFDLGCLFD
jgi:hypothetical protein